MVEVPAHRTHPNPMHTPKAWRHAAGFLLGTLKLRITVGVMLALVLGMGVSSLVLVQRAEGEMRHAVHDRELSDSVHAAAALSRRVVDFQQALRLTAEQLDAQTLGNDAALRRFLASQAVLRGLFGRVAVVWPDGRLHMMVDDQGLSQPKLDLSDRSFIARCVAEQRPIVSEASPSHADDEAQVVFAHPLIHGGQVRGVLTGMFSLSQRDLLAAAVDLRGDPDAVLQVVTDAHGRILAHPDRSMVLAPLSKEPRLAAAEDLWQASGAPVEPTGLSYAAGGELVSASGVAGPDWVVWRAVADSRLLGPLHAARTQAMVWAAGVLTLTSLAALAALAWLLRPLQRLQQRAQHLFDEAVDPASGWPQASGEIGLLAEVLRRVGTERRKLEQHKRELLGKLASVMGNAPVGIAFTRDQRFELVSTELCRLLGHTEAELLGRPSHLIYASMDDYDALGPKVAAAFAAGQPFVDEVEMVHANGRRFWAHLRGRPVDAADRGAGTIWTVTDVSAEVATRTRLEWSAHHDMLTGLANRNALEQRLARCLDTRPAALPAALVMIDLDRFKPVNDTAGHAAGDAMLQAVAAALRARLRSRDLAARVGGDEFALLLEHCPAEAALGIAEEVRAAIGALSLSWGEHRLEVGASIGMAHLSADTASVAAWLQQADEACYGAKAAGRGQVCSAPVRRPPLRLVGLS